MSQNILERIRAQVEQANQGKGINNPQVPLTDMPNGSQATPNGFSIGNGMLQTPGSAPKTLSNSYLSQ